MAALRGTTPESIVGYPVDDPWGSMEAATIGPTR